MNLIELSIHTVIRKDIKFDIQWLKFDTFETVSK